MERDPVDPNSFSIIITKGDSYSIFYTITSAGWRLDGSKASFSAAESALTVELSLSLTARLDLPSTVFTPGEKHWGRYETAEKVCGDRTY